MQPIQVSALFSISKLVIINFSRTIAWSLWLDTLFRDVLTEQKLLRLNLWSLKLWYSQRGDIHPLQSRPQSVVGAPLKLNSYMNKCCLMNMNLWSVLVVHSARHWRRQTATFGFALNWVCLFLAWLMWFLFYWLLFSVTFLTVDSCFMTCYGIF